MYARRYINSRQTRLNKKLFCCTQIISCMYDVRWMYQTCINRAPENYLAKIRRVIRKMEARNATELRITRRGTIGPCKCKVGSCRKCGSRCKRCKCQCDGFSILDTLDRISKNQYDKDALKNKKKRRFQ